MQLWLQYSSCNQSPSIIHPISGQFRKLWTSHRKGYDQCTHSTMMQKTGLIYHISDALCIEDYAAPEKRAALGFKVIVNPL